MARSSGNVVTVSQLASRLSLTGWYLVAVMVGLATFTHAASSQERRPVRADSLQAVRDSLGITVDSLGILRDSLGQPLDTAVAAKLGLPTAPSRGFPAADSIMQALLSREGFSLTRYAGDTVTFFATTSEIVLNGSSLVEREEMTLEAQSVRFLQEDCEIQATGEPKLFQSGTVLVGDEMNYDTCEYQGVVAQAITSFNQAGVDWILRGGLGIDSGATRLYGRSGNVTTCDEEDEHYHFGFGRVKWVNNNILSGRPATLYIRDVPVLWLPFFFQDMRQGRRSGILVPRFGFNDLVRPNTGYRRHVTNIGFYLAVSDYVDARASVDWFAGTSVTLSGEMRYRWLSRFLRGGVSVSRLFESTGEEGSGGRRSTRLAWTHQQNFNQRTSLNANVDFATSSAVIEQNTVNPALQTANLQSRINFSKQFNWGSLNVGGSRSQDLSNDRVTQTLPSLQLTPVPISIGSSITWSPTFSFTTNRVLNQRLGLIDVPPIGGIEQEPDTLFGSNRSTNIAFGTPLRIGRWNWQNSFRVADTFSEERIVETFPDPNDSTATITRVSSGDFATTIDWETGINLPQLFPATWKLQPTLGIRNKTSGAFMVRNRFTNGEFVQQGKRLDLGLSVAPTLFGLFPGLGPIARIRHAFSPRVSWNYAPAATVAEEFARAINPRATDLDLESPVVNQINIGLSQTFEGKYRQSEADSAANLEAQKIRLLNWQTSSIGYDFKQAEEPGRNGWTTQTLSNTFTSDLLRGFSLSVQHDLWDGTVGFDTTRFDPFLRSVSARFSLSGATFVRLFKAIVGSEELGVPEGDPEVEADTAAFGYPGPTNEFGGPSTAFRSYETLARPPQRGRGFTVSVNYDETRTRTDPDEEANLLAIPTNTRTLGYQMAFSPTPNWSLSWNSLYNFTTGSFGQNVIRLDRDLHRWRATFGFTRAPNGNFAFTFFVSLLDQPELKFNYDQQDIN